MTQPIDTTPAPSAAAILTALAAAGLTVTGHQIEADSIDIHIDGQLEPDHANTALSWRPDGHGWHLLPIDSIEGDGHASPEYLADGTAEEIAAWLTELLDHTPVELDDAIVVDPAELAEHAAAVHAEAARACRGCGATTGLIMRLPLDAARHWECATGCPDAIEPIRTLDLGRYAQRLYRLPNGYGASVISRTRQTGLELAVIAWRSDTCHEVLCDGEAGPLTDDTHGGLDEAGVQSLLQQIAALPARNTAEGGEPR